MNSFAGIDNLASANINEAVERIIQTPDFKGSPRICAFLKFIVRETLEGRGDQLKAFAIAVAVYERDESFDPQTSSIVRVEASRLRRLLDHYYEGPGGQDIVRISLPRGSYTPDFSFVEQADPEEALTPGAGQRAVLTPWMAAGLAVGLLLAAGIGLAFWLRPLPPENPATALAVGTLRPVTIVQLPGLRAQEQPDNKLQELKLALESALSASEHVTVVNMPPPQAAEPEYRIEIRTVDGQPEAAEFRAVHQTSGEILWSRTELKASDTARIAAMVASAFTQPSGIMFADQRRRFSARPADQRPFNCIIKGYDFLLHPSSRGYTEAVTCLERAITLFPDFQLAHAIMASVHADAYIYGMKTGANANILELAIVSSQKALAISSHSLRTQSALFRVQFLEGRYEAAFATGENAVARYPDAATLLGRLGSANILRGNFEKGRKQISAALAINAGLTSLLAPFKFIAAFMEDGRSRAAQWASNRMSLQASPLLLIARIIVAHQRGEIDNIQRWSQRLRERYPEFAADIPAGLQRYGMNDEILARLMGGLKEAGVVTPPATARKNKAYIQP